MTLTDKVIRGTLDTLPIIFAVSGMAVADFVMGDSPQRSIENTPVTQNPAASRDIPIGESCSIIGGYMTCDLYVLRDDGSRQYVGQSPSRRVVNYHLNVF